MKKGHLFIQSSGAIIKKVPVVDLLKHTVRDVASVGDNVCNIGRQPWATFWKGKTS